MIRLKTEEDIETLKRGGKILASILRTLSKEVRPGVSTKYLEEIGRKLIEKNGARPAFLAYTPKGASRAYPAALCLSVNEEIVHGIPNENPKILKEGDIISIDTGIEFEGMFTDSAVTVACGKIDPKARDLIEATREALSEGIKAAKPGKKTGDIGAAVAKVAKKRGFSLAEDLGGHGVGFSQHEDPFIPNFSAPNQGVLLKEGMVIAIEPMLNEGKSRVKFLDDGYTVITADKKRSAHFEHTVAITKTGAKILTE